MTSAKSHTDRVAELNMRQILKLIPGGDQFIVSGHGKIVEKHHPVPDGDTIEGRQREGQRPTTGQADAGRGYAAAAAAAPAVNGTTTNVCGRGRGRGRGSGRIARRR